MMPPMPPTSQPPVPALPAASAPTMNCPHCGKPVTLQKPPTVAPKVPAKKKNAASAPMDELKEVLKDKSDGND